MAKNLSDYQDDVFSHLITLNLYTPLCICFPLPGGTSKSQLIDKLTRGLEILCASFPWLAGKVIREDSISKIVPLGKISPLIVKDLTNDSEMPPMEALRKANFPSSMLNGAVLTNLNGLPTNNQGEPSAVLILQANFIKGGLLLNFAGEHGIMDGHGLGQVIRLFSKACYNEPFTEEEVLHGNRARKYMIPLLDQATYKPGPELNNLIRKPKPDATSAPASNDPSYKFAWAYFHFSSSSLSELKSIASSGITVPYITSNDAVSAFIWQATSRIRSSRIQEPQTTSTFARAVDVRSSLSIPPTYLGNMTNHTYNTLPLSSIPSTSLSSLASDLRLALKPSNLSLGIRSLATQLSLTADKSTISYGANMDFSSDIFFSSWAGLSCYSLGFNLGLGFAEAVRRPRFMAIEGLMYLMPMDRNRGLDALIGLREDDLEGLRNEKEFTEYAEWIG